MKRPARHWAATVLLVAAGLPPALASGASTGERVIHFVTPGREIECDMILNPEGWHDYSSLGSPYSSKVVCGIHRNQVQFHNLDLEKPSRRWVIEIDDPAMIARTGRHFSPATVRVLRHGQTVSLGVFRCTSRTAGVTCLSRQSGKGFFLSNRTQRTF